MSLQDLFGIELPIIQAPMAGVQDSALAIAVSNAGGLGSLPCGMLDSKKLQEELATIKAKTSKPYNLNFFTHDMPGNTESEQQIWQEKLAPYYHEAGISPEKISSGASRMPFNEEVAQIIKAFKPDVISFHFGLPKPELLAIVREMGAKIISSATTVEEALWLEDQGVDAIIAQGLEAGGHRGMFLTKDIHTQIGTFALLSQVLDAVNIPVIAAGGIADAKGVKAAMAMGASGVQIGTAYMLCHEATTSYVHRAALKSPEAQATALTNIFSGGPARGIVNRVMRKLGPMCDHAPPYPMATAAVAPLRAHFESHERGDFSPLWAGQNTSGCKEISATALTKELAGL